MKVKAGKLQIRETGHYDSPTAASEGPRSDDHGLGLPQVPPVDQLPFTASERAVLKEIIKGQSCPECGEWVGSLWSLVQHLKDEHPESA